MEMPTALGFALGFVVGMLFKFTVTIGNDLLMIGFRAIDWSGVLSSKEMIVFSVIISTSICLILGMICGRIGRELGEVL